MITLIRKIFGDFGKRHNYMAVCRLYLYEEPDRKIYRNAHFALTTSDRPHICDVNVIEDALMQHIKDEGRDIPDLLHVENVTYLGYF